MGLAKPQISFDQFLDVDVRVGTIIAVNDFPEAYKPAWKLTIDFGPDIGVKKSSAQITALYSADNLKGRQVVAVVNFPPRQIGPFTCLKLKNYYGFGRRRPNASVHRRAQDVPGSTAQ